MQLWNKLFHCFVKSIKWKFSSYSCFYEGSVQYQTDQLTMKFVDHIYYILNRGHSNDIHPSLIFVRCSIGSILM